MKISNLIVAITLLSVTSAMAAPTAVEDGLFISNSTLDDFFTTTSGCPHVNIPEEVYADSTNLEDSNAAIVSLSGTPTTSFTCTIQYINKNDASKTCTITTYYNTQNGNFVFLPNGADGHYVDCSADNAALVTISDD